MDEERVMDKETIIREDGRYLIFYSFNQKGAGERKGGEEDRACRN
ncbi:MAG: hypothetical protein WAO23_04705 [Dethiobacteria bacterium]